MLYSQTNQLKTLQAKALVDYLTDVSISGSCYLMVSEGVAYVADPIPDDLSITESATVDDVLNPLFFKKINLSGADSSVKYVKPDTAGLISAYSQRYSEVAEADIFDENVRHVMLRVNIPKNDINISDTVRGFAIVADLITAASTLATGDKYLASEVDLTDTTGNRLLYLENRTAYERIGTNDGEFVQIIVTF